MQTCWRCGGEVEKLFTFRGHEYCSDCYCVRAAKTSHICALEVQYPDIKIRHKIVELTMDVDEEGNGIVLISSLIRHKGETYSSEIHFQGCEISILSTSINTLTPLTEEDEHGIIKIEEEIDAMLLSKDAKIDDTSYV